MAVQCTTKKILSTLCICSTSGDKASICNTNAGTDRMCIKNMVINLSEKFAATNGLKANVTIAERDTCLNAILMRPNPFNRRF